MKHTIRYSLLLGLLLLQIGCAKKMAAPLVTDSSSAIVQNSIDTSPVAADTAASTATVHAKKSADTTTAPARGQSSVHGNITISSPRKGERVSASGFRITGLARTFENAVSYRVSDQAEKVMLAEGHTMAMGEMGKFSPYVIEVRPKQTGVKYPVEALIEVFEHSAKDGSEINRALVRVLIAP